MPYADAEKQREAVRAWRKAHPERVREHRKKSMVKRAAMERRLPRLSSIEHHSLTDEEVTQLVKRVLTVKYCRSYKDPLECICLLYTSPSPRDVEESRMPSSA